MKLAQKQRQTKGPDGVGTKALQVFLPKPLAQRAKSVAADNGIFLRDLVKLAIEQYLDQAAA